MKQLIFRIRHFELYLIKKKQKIFFIIRRKRSRKKFCERCRAHYRVTKKLRKT